MGITVKLKTDENIEERVNLKGKIILLPRFGYQIGRWLSAKSQNSVTVTWAWIDSLL